MQLNNKEIIYSKGDISKGVNLPNILTPDLAEIIGIILGDGHIEFNKKYSRTTAYSIYVAGSLSEDMDYYKNEINPIFFKLFNTKFNISSQRNDELIVRLYSKAIATFITKLGIKLGNKVDNNIIPKIILDSNNLVKRAFLKGIFDTEGSIMFKKDYFSKHSKPIISLGMKSYRFILELRNILEGLGFTVIFYKDKYFDKRNSKQFIIHKINLAGKKNLKKYLNIIGFRNPKHLTKIAIWNKFGFYPPRLNLQQRKDVLNGKLSIKEVYL